MEAAALIQRTVLAACRPSLERVNHLPRPQVFVAQAPFPANPAGKEIGMRGHHRNPAMEGGLDG
jgi:hypothetical protein